MDRPPDPTNHEQVSGPGSTSSKLARYVSPPMRRVLSSVGGYVLRRLESSLAVEDLSAKNSFAAPRNAPEIRSVRSSTRSLPSNHSTGRSRTNCGSTGVTGCRSNSNHSGTHATGFARVASSRDVTSSLRTRAVNAGNCSGPLRNPGDSQSSWRAFALVARRPTPQSE